MQGSCKFATVSFHNLTQVLTLTHSQLHHRTSSWILSEINLRYRRPPLSQRTLFHSQVNFTQNASNSLHTSPPPRSLLTYLVHSTGNRFPRLAKNHIFFNYQPVQLPLFNLMSPRPTIILHKDQTRRSLHPTSKNRSKR